MAGGVVAKAGGARGGGAGSRWRTRGRDGRWSGSEDIRLDSGVAGSPVKQRTVWSGSHLGQTAGVRMT